MDSQFLQELLDNLSRQNGGMVLKQGDSPQAVVLSVAKYQDLLANRAKAGNGNGGGKEAKKPKVLVTGGCGYIGAHTVRELLLAGYEVVVYDNLVTGKKEHLPDGVTLVQGDIRDEKLLSETLYANKIEAVVHLAALVEVGESVEKPAEYLDVNVGGTGVLLAACAKAGITRLIFSSTAAVYGNQSIIPIPETAPTAPLDPYGTSKLLAEQLIAYHSEFLNITSTVLRFFNVCGGVKEWGIKDSHSSHLIPKVLESLQGKSDKIVIHGSDYATPDGSPVRDYIHVRDIARAHLVALETSVSHKFRVYNVGTGKGFSVKEIIAKACELSGKMLPMEIGPRRPGDSAVTVADSKLIAQELNFVLQYSSLENILQSSMD